MFGLEMHKDSILSVEHLSKHYGHGANMFELFTGLSFEMPRGTVMGLVGSNGSGKTTLLKILAGIVRPSAGRVVLRGDMQSVIELGQNFHPELTGIENIESILTLANLKGEERQWIRMKAIEFCGLGDKLAQPVKNYSSGMLLRLGFALQSHLKSDLVLVDEIIAVGDSAFQKRCNQRIVELIDQGVSFILATHDSNLIQYLCTECLLMDGPSTTIGPTSDILDKYQAKKPGKIQMLHRIHETIPASSPVELVSVSVSCPNGNPPAMDQPLVITLTFDVLFSARLGVAIHAYHSEFSALFTLNNLKEESIEFVPGRHMGRVQLPADLFAPGKLTFDLLLHDGHDGVHRIYKRCVSFEISKSAYWKKHFTGRFLAFPLAPVLEWEFEKQLPTVPPILRDPALKHRLAKEGIVVLPELGAAVTESMRSWFDTHRGDMVTGPVNVSVMHPDPALRRRANDFIIAALHTYLSVHFIDYQVILGTFFAKAMGDDSRVDMHHDPTYSDPELYDDFSLWIPLVDVSEQCGELLVVKGSHLWTEKVNCPTHVPSYLRQADFREPEPLYLQAGHPVLFYNRLVHGSAPNLSLNLRPAVSIKLTHADAALFAYYRSPGSDTLLQFHLTAEDIISGKHDESNPPQHREPYNTLHIRTSY